MTVTPHNSQHVTATLNNEQYTFRVERAVLAPDLIKFEGFDPSECPEPLHEHFRFASRNLTAILTSDTVTIDCITPSPDPVPNPNPDF